jgi:hypothetical protein
MTAFNVVRAHMKPGCENEFLKAHRTGALDMAGFRRRVLIKTAERTYCAIGEWVSMEALGAARSAMTSYLERFRDTLEDLAHGLGISDAFSDEVILDSKDLMVPPPARPGTGTAHPGTIIR